MPSLTRPLAIVALVLVPTLPLLGCARGGKENENPGGTAKETPLAKSGTEKETPLPRPTVTEKELPIPESMQFVRVPKDTFWMGWDSDNQQSKRVEIPEDFALAAYTVTQEQWETGMGTNPSYFARHGEGKEQVKNISDADLKRFPVENVSWEDVQEFLKKLNAREQGKGWLYRLPSEAEWEYACRGAATSKAECSFDFYLDKPTDDLSSTQANFDGDFPAGKAGKGPYLGRPAKVGSYVPNKLGLYDMHGNVWQWCADLVDGEKVRVIRGGSWSGNVTGPGCRAAFRGKLAPSDRGNDVGFRVCRVPSGAKQQG
jgi:formylglycine-generating enzyme required for sulfatase activity